jgi:hypothetical protein
MSDDGLDTGDAGDLPVCERITLNVLETLAEVSVAGGYRTDLSVERRVRGGNTPRHLLAVVHEGDDEELGDDETDNGSKAWVRPYVVQIYVLDSELTSADRYHQVLNVARADVAKALARDNTRGGWAYRTEIRGPVELDDPNDAGGVLVYFDVHYRHDEMNPYNRVTTGG